MNVHCIFVYKIMAWINSLWNIWEMNIYLWWTTTTTTLFRSFDLNNKKTIVVISDKNMWFSHNIKPSRTFFSLWLNKILINIHFNNVYCTSLQKLLLELEVNDTEKRVNCPKIKKEKIAILQSIQNKTEEFF